LGELAHEIMLGQMFFSPRGAYSWGGEGGVPVAVPGGIPSPWTAYYGVLLFFVLSAWGMLSIARSRQGLIWSAMAGSELTARASGVDVARHKRRAFLASGLFAAAAGVGFAAHVGRATASDLSLELSFQAVTFAAIGGRGTILGPMAASLLLHSVLQGGGAPPTARILLYVLILLVVLRFFPAGVAGTLRDRLRARKMIPEGAGGER
jgi:branched-chain amino acid transport system permease protein